MGKMKICLVGVGLLITVLSIYICYSIGWASGFTEAGKQAGYMVGLKEAINVQDETAFMEGCNSGIREVVRSVCNPNSENQTFRKITREDLDAFLKADKTDELKYSDNFTCSGYALKLKRNANYQGIACAFVVLNYKNEITGKTDTGHIINAFKYVPYGKTYTQKKDGTWTVKDNDYENTLFVDPQSDEILSFTDLEGMPYQLCGKDWSKYINCNLRYDWGCFQYYNIRFGKVVDRIIKVDLIW